MAADRGTTLLVLAALVAATGCAASSVPDRSGAMDAQPTASVPPPADPAEAFVDSAETVLYELGVRASRAGWVQANFITHDTELLAAEANERYVAAQSAIAKEAARFRDVRTSPEVRRKLDILAQGLTMPAPADPELTSELALLASRMESRYGSGQYCLGGECRDLGELSEVLAQSRNPEALEEAWAGWRTIAIPMRDEYRRFVELTNRGARELGYPDVGAMWRAGYDMPADEFARELERLWQQVRPLYESLHCYVRSRLIDRYGPELVPPEGPIPAHLLGNMWAQGWGNIYPLVAPPDADPGYDLTARLEATGADAVEMVRIGERFFTSLGLAPLPETFWERSLFTQPRDRDVVCHASAWNIDEVDDLRIKMCIRPTAEDFQTIHHELGHNFYQRAYRGLPYLFRTGANDGFHEALGDAVALSITPEYLERIGLIEDVPPPSQDLGLLMRDALEKVAFLPFGLLVDQWRWQVFSGEVPPAEYNRAWWEMRERYQGVAPPVQRTEDHFDPGAKYHVPANVPYTRYFLAHILQFQFHRALCEAAGYQGPLNRCSIYGSDEAGRRLQAMMELGASRPWPDALEALTGEREMDATALLDYFAPLRAWLEEQNRGRSCGW